MQNLIDFFSKGQTPSQWALFVAVFILCWNLENLFGVTKNYKKWPHDLTNAFFMLPGALSQFVLAIIFARGLAYVESEHLGLLERFGVRSAAGQLLAAFIVWDFFYYIYHLLMHKIAAVWRFHAIHHSDRVMNVSTSLREHPGETFIRIGHYMLVTWALGPALWIVTLHQFLQIVSKIIVHSNFRLPEKMDKWASLVLLTPNMHHVHHHESQPYTDSNYGDLLSVWDRAFGTYQHLPASEVRFGLDVMPEGRYDGRFLSLMKLPFQKHFSPHRGTEIDLFDDDDEQLLAPK